MGSGYLILVKAVQLLHNDNNASFSLLFSIAPHSASHLPPLQGQNVGEQPIVRVLA